MCLDRMLSCVSGALPCSAYAAVSRVGRLSKYTPSGVWPSRARCGADGLVGMQMENLEIWRIRLGGRATKHVGDPLQ